MTVSEASDAYKTCTRTIRKWASECGHGLHDAMIANGRYGSKIGGLKSGRLYGKMNKHPPIASLNTLTPEQEAMRFLQRKMRWVCYSSRIHAGSDEGRGSDSAGESRDVYYHVGNRKLTSDELFDLAKRYGFEVLEQG